MLSDWKYEKGLSIGGIVLFCLVDGAAAYCLAFYRGLLYFLKVHILGCALVVVA